MNLFFAPDICAGVYTLSAEESHHCVKVLRMTEGEKIILLDGRGGYYTTEIVFANQKRCQVKILESILDYEKRNYYLHIAIAPTKNIDRFKWFLEKATEIGIDEITPIECFHSERRFLNAEKLDTTIIAAMKQSVKAFQPKLNPMTDFETFLKTASADEKYIAHCNAGNKIPLYDIYKKETSAIVLIGPEGDFSLIEVEKALNENFTEISLGKSRLRTETAGIVACHTLNLLNNS
ncbi:MAG: 16S rRNA (uracil(1498)-N(3))-methyltransferase [Paludibacteraceae bacterium]|nr:16S rRNA (uracil(1498)-N(3))-methyltransferase [Paludibacteraceae bacterium]